MQNCRCHNHCHYDASPDACRSESRSKKNRDSSLSPKGGSSSFGKDADLKEDQKVVKKAEKAEAGELKSKKTVTAKESSGDNKKDDKKSAVEKRKEFQSHKNPS